MPRIGLLGVFATLIVTPSVPAQTPSPYAGLWVGAVTLQSVTQPRTARPRAMKPAGGIFQFRLILHVDAEGRPRLLKQVALLSRRPATSSPQAKAPARRYRLLVNDANIRRAADSEKLTGVRISTIAFDFPGDALALSGRMAPGQTVRGGIRLDNKVATNPFLHRYHPDHSKPDANR